MKACVQHYKYFLANYGYILPFLGLRVNITTTAISFKKQRFEKKPLGFPFRKRSHAGWSAVENADFIHFPLSIFLLVSESRPEEASTLSFTGVEGKS